MSMNQLSQNAKIIQALAPITPSGSNPRRVSLKDYGRVTVIIDIDNGTPVTGSVITLKQAQNVAGLNEKALSFVNVRQNLDTDADDALADLAVVSDAFTSDTTANKNLQYIIEINTETLDSNGDFDVFSVDIGDGANMAASITYVLGDARYKDGDQPSAIVD